MKVSFEGMGESVATFEVRGGEGLVPGTMVTLCGNGRVCACTAEGDVPVGKALEIRGGYVSVQLNGYMKLPCAEGLEAGVHRLACNAAGKVKTAGEGREALVVDVDAENGVCGAIL